MKTIEYKEPSSPVNALSKYYKHFYPNSKLLFFDIETTGFTAKNTTLYLIGALWYENNHIHVIQWFNDDGYSEKDLLSAFDTFCKNFTHLIHFNGLGFDLPYLRQKADLLNIPFSADTELTQIDIFKEIRSYKKIFLLENMKQVSIERFLGIEREDTYTGGELINIYQRYIARPDEEKEHLLLLHNHDDLLGMPQISQILQYKAFFEDMVPTHIHSEVSKHNLTFHFEAAHYAALPKRISTTKNGIYLNAIQQSGLLQIPIYTGTLKHFFKDYKNYYYLPKEDMAIHKSIATYVENANKTKAAKSTCYIKKTDAFVPCPFSDYPEIFKCDCSDKTSYQTLDSLLQSDSTKQAEYIKTILSTLK